MRASSCLLSWTWPPVRMKRSGLPSASTTALILVLGPPRDRPIPSSSVPLFFARCMLVCTDDSGIDDEVLVVRTPSSPGMRSSASARSAAHPRWQRALSVRRQSPRASAIFPPSGHAPSGHAPSGHNGAAPGGGLGAPPDLAKAETTGAVGRQLLEERHRCHNLVLVGLDHQIPDHGTKLGRERRQHMQRLGIEAPAAFERLAVD